MKKLLYIIPLLLIVLSIAGISLHNDMVNYKVGGGLKSLTPSHWKLMNYELNASVDLSQSASVNSSQVKAYSDGAKFYGFPFGLYFSNDQKTGSSSLNVSAYSWLWIAVDILLLIISLLVAWGFNRKPKVLEPIPGAITPAAGTTVSPNDIYPPPPVNT